MSAAPSTHNEKDLWVPLCIAAVVSTVSLTAFFHFSQHDPKDINEQAFIELGRHNVMVALVLGALWTCWPMTLCVIANLIRKCFRWSKWMICPIMAAIILAVACIPAVLPREMSDYTTLFDALSFGVRMFGMTVPFGLVFSLLLTRNRTESK